jgi:hypothetical protein
VAGLEPAAVLGLAANALAPGGAAEGSIEPPDVDEAPGVDEAADRGVDVDCGAAAVQPTNTSTTRPAIAVRKRSGDGIWESSERA